MSPMLKPLTLSLSLAVALGAVQREHGGPSDNDVVDLRHRVAAGLSSPARSASPRRSA